MKSPGIRSLLFFERLLVGPVRVEARKVKATYRLTLKNGDVVENELVYAYTAEVFDHSDDDLNLASMMVSQVALNYGLFCREIIFDGLYEDTDKRFLSDMLENTSREIYVNKFLFPNEFLVAPYNNLNYGRQERYTAARISFVNSLYPDSKVQWEHRETRRDSFMILSSGGKDSLLSYGLLKELNKEGHPVFINESGRHWYTALNAFRFMQKTEPGSDRVWCNSDRIFNWMLRQMPCIRKDFASVRSDMYPVRLWTVAVFLFGVLPLAQKKGAGNIIIGDEYDTTMKSTFRGITHYRGLYDQSRYFDQALTRYYTKKGWNLFQFSILRSLSELLILKILVKRYPDLQEQQVSCHAAHIRNNRAYPCGRCEKCRRIIAMLRVLGESPARCGYTEEQTDNALFRLGTAGVKQIGSDAAHLYHLLLEKQLIPEDSPNAGLAARHPHIMKMRFDRERSRLNDLPAGLYMQLIPIYLQYADGAVMRQHKQWSDLQVIPGL